MAKLTEFVQSDASGAIDREAGVIRGVKLLGLRSRNGRRYAEAALRKAIGLYEGARVHVDHGKPGESRSLMTRGGTIRAVTFREGDGLYGDLHYLKGDAAGEKIATLAEQCPDTFGMSHDVDGRVERSGGDSVVEEISEVNSVDAVDRPATTNSLHEQVAMKTNLRKLIEATGYKHTHKLLEMMPELTAEEPIEAPESTEADPVQAVAAALAAKVADAIADPAVSDAEVGQMAKAASKTVAAVRADMEPAVEQPDEEPDSEDEGETEEKVAESVAIRHLTTLVEGLRRQVDARAVLEAKGATVTPQLLEELAACRDRNAMESLVEGWAPAKLGRAKPTVTRIAESSGTSYPKTTDEFVRELKRSRG